MRAILAPGWGLVLLVGCGSTSNDVNALSEHDGGDASAPHLLEAGGGDAGASDAAAIDSGPPDYFVGQCEVGGVPTDGGVLPRGLTVLATGITAPGGLAVDATYAYFATSSGISRVPLAGGSPVMMVSGASPLSMALSGNALVWSDATIASTTTVLTVPVTAVGWSAFGAGDAGSGAPDAGADSGAAVATQLAAIAGSPGAFTVADAVYFTADSVVYRVATTGGPVQTVSSGLAPTGIAVGSATAYLGDSNNESIDAVALGPTDGGPIESFAISNASPTQVAINDGNLYWGDFFGAIEYVAIATPDAVQVFGTPCGGAGCYPNFVVAGGPGALWEADDGICGHVGTVGPQGTTLFATNIDPAQAIAGDAQHLYVATTEGQLLRWDL